MPFTSETAKLHRGRGGRKRKTHPDVVVRKAVNQIAREYIETHVEPVLQNYIKLAKGWNETRYSDGGHAYEVFCHDAPTTRHFIDKVLPDEKAKESQTGDTYIQFNFGLVAGPAVEPGVHNGNGRSFDGRALYLGSDEGGSE